jgi:hypothetical protein
MSDSFVTAFSEPAAPDYTHDLLARLYHEIGVAAVAAALGLRTASEEDHREAPRHAMPAAFVVENLAA